MIPEHLKHIKFDPSTFYRMKNKKAANYGINDDGITQIARQVGVIGQEATTEHLELTEKRIVVAVRVTLHMNGGAIWQAVASAASSEFEQNDWEDRRRYHLAQMAMTRAKNNALMAAIGATNADINAIASDLGIKGEPTAYEDKSPEPESIVEETEESKEEQKKQQDDMRKRMKAMQERSAKQ